MAVSTLILVKPASIVRPVANDLSTVARVAERGRSATRRAELARWSGRTPPVPST
jgi:hypothetical protein